jgi:hypothetical protein
MANKFARGHNFTDGPPNDDVIAAYLHALIEEAAPTTAFVDDQVEKSLVAGDYVFVKDTSGSRLARVKTDAFVLSTVSLQTGLISPAATSSTAGVMAGLGATLTPVNSGKISVTICGSMKNTGANYVTTVRLYYGSGTAPVNGAALTGTVSGGIITGHTAFANAFLPYSVSAVLSGRPLNQPTWFDVSIATSNAAGMASVHYASVCAYELR